MLRAGAIAASAAALAVCASAAGATPAQLLARDLRSNSQAHYDKAYPGLKITTVTCTIAKSLTRIRAQVAAGQATSTSRSSKLSASRAASAAKRPPRATSSS